MDIEEHKDVLGYAQHLKYWGCYFRACTLKFYASPHLTLPKTLAKSKL